MKRCPKCVTTKTLTDFYAVAARSDGYASWCKVCSNSARPKHKKSIKLVDYAIIAKVVSKEGKPTTCPKCFTLDVPSNRMRGRIVEGEVKWSCFSCRQEALKKARHVILFCDWCCDEFSVPPSASNKRFCATDCANSWRAAVASRRSRAALETP